jgi:molybdopterin synthase sulfur carrier subunit
MTVKAKFFAYFRDLFEGRERDVVIAEGGTVRDALSILCDTPGRRLEIFEGDSLKPHLVVMVNGIHVGSLNGLDTPLAPGDTLAIFPMLGGG